MGPTLGTCFSVLLRCWFCCLWVLCQLQYKLVFAFHIPIRSLIHVSITVAILFFFLLKTVWTFTFCDKMEIPLSRNDFCELLNSLELEHLLSNVTLSNSTDWEMGTWRLIIKANHLKSLVKGTAHDNILHYKLNNSFPHGHHGLEIDTQLVKIGLIAVHIWSNFAFNQTGKTNSSMASEWKQ